MKKITLLVVVLSITFLQSCAKQYDCVCTESSGNSYTTATLKTHSSSRINKFKDDCKLSSVNYYNNGVYIGSTSCAVK